MRYLCYLSLQSWKKKTSKYVSVLVGTLLSASFLVGLLGLAFSLYNMYLEDACQNYGSYDVVISDGTKAEYEKLQNNENITQIGFVGKKSGYHIGAYQLALNLCDDSAMEMEAVRLLEGSLPQNKNEIAISRQIKINGKYIDEVCQIGDSLNIVHKNGKERNYIISGILDDFNAGKNAENSKFSAYLFQKQFKENADCKIYAKVEHGNLYANIVQLAEEIGFTEKDIAMTGNIAADQAKLCINGELIPYYSWTTLNEKGGFGSFLIMTFVIILFTSILFLLSRNLITLKQNRKELAFYKMQGFQDKQLVALLWLENMLPGVLGIFMGECLGLFVQKLLVSVIMKLRVHNLDNLKAGMPWYIYVGSGVFLFVVLAVVELFPVLVIRKVSPVEALGNSIVSKKRNRKKEKNRNILLPISVWLGIQYTVKEKVRTFITVLTLSVTSGILFLLLFFGKNASIRLQDTYDEDSKFQYTITSIENQNLLDNGYVTDLIADADEIYGLAQEQVSLCITGAGERKDWLRTEYKSYVPEELLDIYFPEGKQILVSVEGVDRAYYEKYTSQDIVGEVPEYDTLCKENGCIIYDDFWYSKGQGEVEYAKLLQAQEGEEIYYSASENYETQEKTEAGSYTVKARAARKWKKNSETSWNHVDVYIVVPKENMLDRFGSCYLSYIHLNTSLEKIHKLGKWLESNSQQYNFMVTDHVENVLATRDKNMITLAGIFFVAILLFVISMIVVKQTITIGILERKEDMRMLERIGMSKKHYIVMLLAEDIFYSICSIIIGSILLMGMIQLPFIQQMTWSWNMWDSLCSTVLVFSLIFATTSLSSFKAAYKNY